MADTSRPTGFSLRRWSQRKHAAARGEPELQRIGSPAKVAPKAAAAPSTVTPADVPTAALPCAANQSIATKPAAAESAIPLPPLESLTIDSDFSPFMQPGVDEALKRTALRKLLRHPRFNVMDGLDVYIDDYSKPSPLEPELARTLAQARYIFDPPKTRVRAEGFVEDVPDETIAATNATDTGDATGDIAGAPAVDASTSIPIDAAVPPVGNDVDVPAPTLTSIIKPTE